MAAIPRLVRLLLFAALAIILPTLYFLYPGTPQYIPSPSDPVITQAGGIDSDHWGEPIAPDPGLGSGRSPATAAVAIEHEEIRDDEKITRTQIELGGNGGGWEGPGVGVEKPVKEGASPVGGLGDRVEGVIMPKLGNATAKAELGRAAWKVLHLMTLRFPDTPTPTERESLKDYFRLFAQLYPCGECAAEFQTLLKQYPPQTSSRKTASLWLCHVHNLINERLGKPEFDCLTLDSTYDCGCGPLADAETNGNGTTTAAGTGNVDTGSGLAHGPVRTDGDSGPLGGHLVSGGGGDFGLDER